MSLNTDPMVEQLLAKRDANLSKIESLKSIATDEGRALTDAELESVETYKRDIGGLDRQLEAIGDDLSLDVQSRQRLTGMQSAASNAVAHRSAGDLIHDLLHLSDGAAQARYKATLKRAAEHMGTIAADTTATAGDIAELYVDPIVGPVIRPDNSFMPLTAALGLRSMPSGSAFERPYIDDAAFATGVAAQSAQKAELASKKFDAATDLIKRTTIGGYLNVSAQMLTWQPGSLGQIVDQMRARLSAAIEAFVFAEVDSTTNNEVLAVGADGPTTIKAIYDASAAVYGSTNQVASMLVAGPLGWARLGSLVDLGGRPLLPSLSPVNAVGSMSADTLSTNGVAGLRTVVSPAIADSSFYILNSECIETYGYMYPLMEAVEPSVLGRQIAVAADVVAHTPTPYANAIVHLAEA